MYRQYSRIYKVLQSVHLYKLKELQVQSELNSYRHQNFQLEAISYLNLLNDAF